MTLDCCVDLQQFDHLLPPISHLKVKLDSEKWQSHLVNQMSQNILLQSQIQEMEKEVGEMYQLYQEELTQYDEFINQ